MASADPMDTDTDEYLAKNHQDVTILALRMSSRKRLGMYLDMDAIPLHSGLLPNYQGLAECIGFEFIEQMSFQRNREPTQALLMEWGNRQELKPTLGNLVKFLVELERVDVLEECKEIIRNDVEFYLKKKAAGSSEISPVQDSTVSQSPFNIDEMEVDESAIMTIQDVEAGRPTYYDAFVCFHPEGEDLKFVKEMIEKMECPPHNLRLFVPHRDDLPGASKYVISAKLIQDRCKRMVIVMSPRYLKSDACDFQTKFAHALSPGSRSKKLIPVLVTQCEKPNILLHVTTCDYTRGDMTGWFWDRLIKSLQAPLNPHDITIDNPSDLSLLEMNVEARSLTFPSMVCASSPSEGSGGSGSPSGRRQSDSGTKKFGQSPSPSVSMSSLDYASPNKGTVSNIKKKGLLGSPQSSSPQRSSTAPSSPSSDRKGGQKKKGLKMKLSSVFSSSHSSSS